MSGSSHSGGWCRGPRMGAAGTVIAALVLLGAGTGAAEETGVGPMPGFGRLAFGGADAVRDGLRLDRFEPPAPGRPLAAPAANRFFGAHFFPRVSSQFRHVVPIAPTPAGTDLADSMVFAAVSETARYHAEKGTRKAVKAYLLEVTTLERTVQAIKVRSKKSGHGAGDYEALRVGVGISHGKPEVEVRRRDPAGTLRIRLGLQGSVGLEFKQLRQRYSRVFVRYDADDDRYDLGCRFSF